jgi:uncharacterized protein
MTPFRVRLAALAIVALLVAAPQAAAKCFVWKVTSPAGRVVYVAGSIHLLTAAYYPLDPAFDRAFAESDLLVEELDMGEMLSANAQLKMLTRGMLPAGRSLEQVISPVTLEAVKRTVNDLGIPLAPLMQFKPWMLALTLQGMAWQKAGFNADIGLDRHFYDLAVQAKKPVQALETLEFQISRFDEMSADVQDRLLADTLKELEQTQATFTRMADAWKAGDTTTVETMVLTDMQSEPQMNERLLLERNRAWLPVVETLFARPRPAFVVVGSAHLLGADGLLESLRAKGYRIEQL